MAKFTAIYNGLITLIEANTTGYERLSDSYNIENNDILRLEKGYSLAISSGVKTERELASDNLWTSRDFIVTFTRLYIANELDAAAKAVIEKSLIEDAFNVWAALQVVTHLGAVQVSNATYVSDEGIEYIYADTHKAISLVSTISIEYFE